MIATARYWIGAERYIKEIQPDYEITTAGTLIHQYGKQLYSRTMDSQNANQVIRDLIRENPETEITVASGRQVFWNNNDEDGVADWIENNLFRKASTELLA